MKYQIDHDIHIHSQISPCSRDENQTKEAIFAYGMTLGLKLLCVTDHFWDLQVDFKGLPGWTDVGNGRWKSILPLPQGDSCKFLFGAEVDMNAAEVVGKTEETHDQMDFCIVSVGHLWLKGFTVPGDAPTLDFQAKKELYKSRLLSLLNRDDLDFTKIGIGHFTHGFEKECLACFSDREYEEIFSLIAQKGAGVELNFTLPEADEEYTKEILRPYEIAKQMGCKFYLGGDAHHPSGFTNNKKKFETMIDSLALTEDDKWEFVKKHIQ